MKLMSETTCDVFWLKIVGMLQHNWARLETNTEGKVVVSFIHDGAVVFDELAFKTIKEAEDGLSYNGFLKFNNHHWMKALVSPPTPPFKKLFRPTYSNGDYWETNDKINIK